MAPETWPDRPGLTSSSRGSRATESLQDRVRQSAGEIIATADADSTYPVKDIPGLVKMLEEERLDFITTDRFALMEKGAMSSRNQFGNSILSFTMRALFNINMKDSQSGMWVFRKSILDDMILKSDWRPSRRS